MHDCTKTGESHAHILTIHGSLRSASINGALMRATAEMFAAENCVVNGHIRDIPPFDEDRESRDGGGEAVTRLRASMHEAHAILFSTPEYNQSLPGVLKNAIDWVSRPSKDSPLRGKPTAVVGATTGPWGTRYAQRELRHVLTATGSLVMPSPMLFIREAERHFEGERLVDEAVREQLRAVVVSLQGWAERVLA